MRNASLYMDGKGIIAPDKADDEESYINYGMMALEASAGFSIDDDVRHAFAKQGIILKNSYNMLPSAAKYIMGRFKTDLSWVVMLAGGCEIKTRLGAATRISYGINNHIIQVPVAIYLRGSGDVMAHECIHILRGFADRDDQAFKEAFAFYDVPNPRHGKFEEYALFEKKLAIVTARRKLEDIFGDNASYALARLSQQEVYGVRDAANPLEYLKGLNCLRHRIVKERLGL